jgi:hypothetical protein
MKDATKEALCCMGQMADKCLTSLGAIQKDYDEFVSLVRRMREARHKYSALSREFCSKGMKPRQSQEWQDARKLTKQLESEVDEYLKKMEE